MSLARKFALDKVQPLVRQMDDSSQLDQSIIDGLFEQGVRYGYLKIKVIAKILITILKHFFFYNYNNVNKTT